MLVDDVITAGTAIRESMEIIAANGADLSGADRSGSSGKRQSRALGYPRSRARLQHPSGIDS